MLPPPVVRVSGIRKTYGATVAIDDVTFEVVECTALSVRVFRWE